jgi:hypothetical protein
VSLVGGLGAQIIVSDGCISFRLCAAVKLCNTRHSVCARPVFHIHRPTSLAISAKAAAGIQLTLCEKIRRGDELLRPSWQEIPFLARGLCIYILCVRL